MIWSMLSMFASFGCSEFSIEDQDSTVSNAMIVEESFLYHTEPQVDILLVLDNTASMTTEHLMLRDSVPLFIETLQNNALSWHLGAITTDVTSTTDSVLMGDPWVLTSTFDDPVPYVLDMIDVGTDGKQPEAGFAATLNALSPDLSVGANRGFRRPTAALHVLVISDGDDDSDELVGGNASQMLMNFLADQRTASGETGRFSALVGPSPSGCTGSSGTALAGQRYLEMADATEGFIGSICDINFAELGDWIAASSQPEDPSFALQANPKPSSVRVQVNDMRWDTGWILMVEESRLQFTVAPPPGAEIQVRYQVQSS